MGSKSLELYFHSPCFDGIASAVLCWDFFENRGEASEVNLHPVGYDTRDTWLSTRLPGRSAVVDYLFHPDAYFWVDHHETSFLTESARNRFDESPSAYWAYDRKAKSCAALLQKHLRKHFGYRNRRYDALVNWAQLIDSASYKDVRQALLAPTAALQISLSLANADAAYCQRLVKALKAQSLSAVASSAYVQRRVRVAKASLKDGLKYFSKAVHLDGDIAVFDVEAKDRMFSRYAPYYFYPRARYSVGVMRRQEAAKMPAMRDPSRPFESVPIGTILARHGGGGHQRVGSVLLKGDAENRARDVLAEVVTEIRELDRQQATGLT